MQTYSFTDAMVSYIKCFSIHIIIIIQKKMHVNVVAAFCIVNLHGTLVLDMPCLNREMLQSASLNASM